MHILQRQTWIMMLTGFCILFGLAVANAEPGDLPPELLGVQPQELHGKAGEPEYIRMVDYGPEVKYVYFTLDEWNRIKDMAPMEVGDDVYVRGKSEQRWQYHITYAPIYLKDRFNPEYRVSEYTIYPETNMTLAEVANLVPQGGVLKGKSLNASLATTQKGQPAVMMITAPFEGEHIVGEYFRKFREKGDMAKLIEVGFKDPIENVGKASEISYISFKLGVGRVRDEAVSLHEYLD